MKIKIADIKVGDNRREINDIKVGDLMKSIAEIGLLNPITVTKKHRLIAGAHRLAACKKLGWQEIECNVMELDGLKAELAEIDENLVRHSLSHIEEGEQLLRKKEIYEQLYPETKKGGDRKSEKIKVQNLQFDFQDRPNVSAESSVTSQKSFVEDSAEKMQVSPRRVWQKIQVARDLTPEVKTIVKEHGLGLDPSLKLARIKEPEKQREAAEKLAAGIPLDKPKPLDEKAMLRTIIAETKRDKAIEMTGRQLLMEYSAAVEETIRQLDRYRTDLYASVYPRLTAEEHKEITALNNAMLEAVNKLNEMQKGNQL